MHEHLERYLAVQGLSKEEADVLRKTLEEKGRVVCGSSEFVSEALPQPALKKKNVQKEE